MRLTPGRRTTQVGREADPESRDADAPIKVVRCWALMGPRQLPVIFRTRADAEENADEDEQMFRAEVVIRKRVTKRRRPFLGIP